MFNKDVFHAKITKASGKSKTWNNNPWFIGGSPAPRLPGPLAVSSKCAGKILIAPTKYRNANNRIRVVLDTTFTADMQLGFAKDSHRAIFGSSFNADCQK